MPPPANDNFAQATLLSGSSLTVTGTTVAATREFDEPSHGVDSAARTVWYSWTAPASGDVQVMVATADFRRLSVALYAGFSLRNLIPMPMGVGFSFYTLAGTTYKIVVAGTNGLEADFALTLTGPPAPPSIDASNTKRLSNGSYQVRVTGVAGQSFIVQASSDSQNWVTIRTDTLVGNTLDFIDTAAAGLSQRFYRILTLDTAFNSQSFTLVGPSYQPDNVLSLRLSGTAGQPFRIQVSTNLFDWADFAGGVLRNGPFGLSDPDAPKFNFRFYRALKQ